MNGTTKLIYVSDGESGYLRKKRGKGFEYFSPRGEKIDGSEIADRLEQLKIPKAWRDVWISKKKNGHLQATGYDEKGRKQYIYHPEWNKYRSLNKFNKMIAFGEMLPEIRKRIWKDLSLIGWPDEKVLALIVLILDESFIRIGNQSYRDENGTYGLTTLRRKHIEENEDSITFKYKAKSGKERAVEISNEDIVRLVKDCSELPGYEIFRFYDKRRGCAVDSSDVNEYLSEITGNSFTSKDFRTWGGTVLAVESLEEATKIVEENPRKELLPTLIQLVANKLGNTPAICRDYYIHPDIIASIETGRIEEYKEIFKHKGTGKYALDKWEAIALQVLKDSEKKREKDKVVIVEK